MIYFTTWHDPLKAREIYKEWTGKEPDFSHPLTNSHLVLARNNTKIIGACLLFTIDDPYFNRRWGLVEDVYITPKYRRKGVAKRMMNFVENQANMMGCEFVKLTSNKKAGQELYRSLGYEEGCSFKKRLRES